MVVQIDNSENRWLHGGGPGNIVLNPPDKRPSKIIYSPLVADEEFNQIIKEINAEQKKAKPHSTLEIPWLIKALGTVGVVGLLAIGIKRGISKLFKH